LSTDATTDCGWPEGVDRFVLGEVDSTNSEAARLAPSLTRPCWILARRQTAARGRRGRAWISPEGNFAATYVFRPDSGPAQAALRSFVAALALADSLDALCGPGVTIALKWPNDVLMNGGKVAGILLESSGQGGHLTYLSIGFGVNLVASPPPDAVETGAVTPVSVLGETGQRIDPETFLAALASAFARREAEFKTRGFSATRAAWLGRAARLGQPVVARLPAERVDGVFESLAEDGALILATPAGKRHIPAADIFF
jgi:BirA family biotin operon repressor/biotin-[acetyl-CoA-carboxylase] ligase